MRALLFSAIVLSASLGFAGINYKTVAAKGETSFIAKGFPSAIKIEGKAPAPEGQVTLKSDPKVTEVSGHFSLDLSKLDTGIGMRDRHMKEKYLEVEKFKNAQLTIDPVSFAGSVKAGKAPFTGKLNLHGVEKPVKGEYELTLVDDKTWAIKANFNLKLSDFNIDVPKFSGITVADEVALNIDSNLEKSVE